MQFVIVDTDVVSALMKGTAQAERFRPHLDGKVPAITFVSIAELHAGAAMDSWGEKRMAQLEQAIRKFTLLPWDPNIPRVWGKLRAAAKAAASPLYQPEHTNDLWIATCAVYYDAPLLTGNRRHMCDLPGLVFADDS